MDTRVDEILLTMVASIREARVSLVTGYPGGPITPLVEELAKGDSRFHIEWSVDEKQAMALAAGVTFMGKRAVVIMKHVGLNVASDAIMGTALNDHSGGLLLIVGDDPGGSVSQNEQDSRSYGQLFHLPILEPSTPMEAERMVNRAFTLSEKYKIPVMIRYIERRIDKKKRAFTEEESLSRRSVIEEHQLLNKKLLCVQHELEDLSYITSSKGDEGSTTYGVISSGSLTEGVHKRIGNMKEPSITIEHLHIGGVYPLPLEKIERLIEKVQDILVFEEGEPFIEMRVQELLHSKQRVRGRFSNDLPMEGPILYSHIDKALANLIHHHKKDEDQVQRVSQRITGRREGPFWLKIESCPIKDSHRALKRVIDPIRDKVVVIGDTGCVCGGIHRPFNTVDTFICMGVSASMAAGVKLAGFSGHSIAIMGDSSFLHSGIQSLMNVVYHRIPITFLILDNRRTGETGRQSNPGTGLTIRGERRSKIVLEELVASCQVDWYDVLEAKSVDENREIISSTLHRPGINVLIIRGPCPTSCSIREDNREKEKGLF